MLFQTFCRWLVFSGQTDRTTLCTESLPSHLGKTQTRWRALRGLYNTRKKGSQLTVSHLLLIFQAVGRQQHGGDQIPAGCEINSIETILVPVGTVTTLTMNWDFRPMFFCGQKFILKKNYTISTSMNKKKRFRENFRKTRISPWLRGHRIGVIVDFKGTINRNKG